MPQTAVVSVVKLGYPDAFELPNLRLGYQTGVSTPWAGSTV